MDFYLVHETTTFYFCLTTFQTETQYILQPQFLKNLRHHAKYQQNLNKTVRKYTISIVNLMAAKCFQKVGTRGSLPLLLTRFHVHLGTEEMGCWSFLGEQFEQLDSAGSFLLYSSFQDVSIR